MRDALRAAAVGAVLYLTAVLCSGSPGTTDYGDAVSGNDGTAVEAEGVALADTSSGQEGAVKNGSRIIYKAKRVTGEDGSSGPVSYSSWDTQRNEACEWRIAEDGELRCLPSGGYWSQQYADSNCTKRVTSLPANYLACYGGILIKAIYLQPTGDCSGAYTVAYTMGAKTSLENGKVYTKASDGTCSDGYEPGTGSDWYLVGEHIAPSSFAKGAIQ